MMFSSLALPMLLSYPPSVLRLYPGEKLKCSATGTPPLYVAIIWNSTVLANTTEKAEIGLHNDGNYSCVAINKFGNDTRVTAVTILGKTFPKRNRFHQISC